MTKRAVSILIAGLIWLGAPASGLAGDSPEVAVRVFVQAFYDWHMKAAARDDPVERVLRDRPEALAHDLRAALEADRRAQADTPDDIVGIDFDPFTSSQDPCDRYKVGEVLADNGTYRVNVRAACHMGADEMPDVIAIVSSADGHWQFTNFEYPENGNLLEILKQLAEGRK